METYMCSRHELKVRFLSPAPIFVFLVMICLCGSAGAVSLNENELYSFNEFNYWLGYGSGVGTIYHPSGSAPEVGPSKQRSVTIFASGTAPVGSGSGTNYNVNLSAFDYPSPSFRFIHVGFSARRNDTVDLTFHTPTIGIYTYVSTSEYAYRRMTFSPSWGSGSTVSLGSYSGPGGVVYHSEYQVYQSLVHFDYYVALPSDTYLAGFSFFWNPGNSPESTSIPIPSDLVPTFELSSTKILPSVSGGSGGSCDLSGITSQINSLSAQMTASFNQVNANIDAAETSISQSISSQTESVNDKIEDTGIRITTNNTTQTSRLIAANRQQHELDREQFDNWDNSLSDAFSPEDAQVVVDANSSVSGVHQFEEDQVDDTEAALDGVGLDGYTIPSEISGTFSEVGTILTLLFNSFGFVTPLIIFSCTFGIAFVLIGRKSRGSE